MRVDWTAVLERRRGRGTPAATPRETTLVATAVRNEAEPMTSPDDQGPVRVVIVGGGVAALEAALALRDLAGSRVALTILSPAEEFVVRPMLVAKPFAKGEMLSIPLADIARDVRAELIHAALASVDAAAHQVITDDGRRIDYDELVITVGARAVPAYPQALTFSTNADRDALCELLRDIEQGHGRRIAFVVPPGVTWPLPMYELALMTAQQAWGMCIDDLTVHLVTPEQQPLEAFGRAPSDDVRDLLDRVGIRLHTATEAEELQDGGLVLHPSEERLERTPIVALPVLEGPRIKGLPSNAHGFIPVDDFGRVGGLRNVYAAGDATVFPVKQGGLAAQQADAVAQMIAFRAGARIEPRPFRPVLRGTLLTGTDDHHLRSTAHGAGVVSEQLMWWPPGKIAGAYLAPYLVGELGSTLVDIPASATSLSILEPIGSAVAT
jgi:sulfide:quinone oxidoreductase